MYVCMYLFIYLFIVFVIWNSDIVIKYVIFFLLKVL